MQAKTYFSFYFLNYSCEINDLVGNRHNFKEFIYKKKLKEIPTDNSHILHTSCLVMYTYVCILIHVKYLVTFLVKPNFVYKLYLLFSNELTRHYFCIRIYTYVLWELFEMYLRSFVQISWVISYPLFHWLKRDFTWKEWS